MVPWGRKLARVPAQLLAEVSRARVRFLQVLRQGPSLTGTSLPPAMQGDVSRAQECLMWIGRTESVGFWTSRRMRTVASFCGGTLFWTPRPTAFSGTWTTPR